MITMVPLTQAKIKSQQTHRIGRVKEKLEDERSVAVRRDRYVWRGWFAKLSLITTPVSQGIIVAHP
jgi:hypothetical protein